MATTLSEYSDANSFRSSEGNNNDGLLCHCGRKTSITKSWSDDNPGRLYFRCDVHTFIAWADEELQCMWQKASLLEARDIIRRQRDEIRQLIAANTKILWDQACVQESNVASGEHVPTLADNHKLEVELVKVGERERKCSATVCPFPGWVF
ncbi:unnamed protein product [Brassica oleracea var. botrytis]|uniref:DUF7900 domain-containing protein n=2 Tax=Brassica TaxID=3705 RepID=A0A3P6EH46_BRAOL|nr:unnamed protein product [Brassica napus]CDY27855.1 BnaC09g28820D [Brassica napus]VDD31792.1 unnamed protein product [Brassica oleracea]